MKRTRCFLATNNFTIEFFYPIKAMQCSALSLKKAKQSDLKKRFSRLAQKKKSFSVIKQRQPHNNVYTLKLKLFFSVE